MSCSTLCEIDEEGDVIPVEQFDNAYRGAILIWAAFAVKYGLATRENRFIFMADMDKAQEIWDLQKRADMPRHDKIVMFLSFDSRAVRKENFGELVTALRRFHDELSEEDKYCHTAAWADAIEKLPNTVMGCAFQHSSVSQNLWRVPDEDDDEESRFYNVGKDTNHAWIFEELANA